MGGTGWENKEYYNFSYTTGELLKIEDICIDINKCRDIMIEYFLNELKKDESTNKKKGNKRILKINKNSNNDIKISDFGISAIHADNPTDNPNSDLLVSNYTRVGRRDFVAPEILKGTVKEFDYKVDIFSLGLTMLCLISKIFPINLQNKKRTISVDNIDPIYNEYLVNLINHNRIDQISCPKKNCSNKELSEEVTKNNLNVIKRFKKKNQYESKL